VTTWTVQATVVKHIDGDTFAASLDLGWGIWRLEVKGSPSRIRILGVDTPERGQLRWAEARDYLAATLPIGTVVWVESTALDSFGRALCLVTLLDGRALRDLYPAEWQV
jgi:micrococcal nuclease